MSLALGVILAAVAVVLEVIVRRYLRLRGQRVVTCPETRAPAGVVVNAWSGSIGGLLGRRELRLQSCSRWPERAGCGEECLREIENAPSGCLVRALLAEWYREKHCVLCGASIGDVPWHERRPCLLATDGITHEWSEFAAEKVPGVLRTHRPICWSCHIAESFRRAFPDLVIDRELSARRR